MPGAHTNTNPQTAGRTLRKIKTLSSPPHKQQQQTPHSRFVSDRKPSLLEWCVLVSIRCVLTFFDYAAPDPALQRLRRSCAALPRPACVGSLCPLCTHPCLVCAPPVFVLPRSRPPPPMLARGSPRSQTQPKPRQPLPPPPTPPQRAVRTMSRALRMGARGSPLSRTFVMTSSLSFPPLALRGRAAGGGGALSISRMLAHTTRTLLRTTTLL